MEGKWELSDDDKTMLVEPGEGVIAYFRHAKDARLAVQAPAMAEALEKAEAALADLGACDDATCREAACSHALPIIRALLTAIKGE